MSDTVVLALIGVLNTLVTGLLAIYLARINSQTKKAMGSAAQTATSAAETALSVEKVHKAVNGEREALQAELAALRDTVLTMTKAQATADERARIDGATS